ncbi:unnamed protein product, partial [Laminaria digitata]
VATSGARALLVDVLGEEVVSDEGEQEEGDGATRHLSVGLQGVLPLISSLRRLCNHPDLVAGRGSREGAGGGGGGGDSIGGKDGGGTGTGGGGGGGGCHRISDNCGGTLREELDDDGDDSGDSDDVQSSGDEEAVEKSRPLSAKNIENNVGVAAAAAAAGTAAAGAAMASPHGKGNNSLANSGGRGPARAWKVPRVVSGATKAKAPVVAARAETGRKKTSKLAAASAELPKYETEASGKVVVLEALLRMVRRAYPSDKV